MDQKKKFCRKKRSIANSMLSLILVFAMVISNVQTSSGMLSTVWAAESEAQTPDGEAETGSVDEGNDSDGEETGEAQKSLDSEETNNEERSEAVAESTHTGESERSEETSEGGNTETTASSTVETETASETETTTETETEATEEDSNAFLGEGDEEKNPAGEQISIKLHFKDVLGWDTETDDIKVAFSSYDSNVEGKWVKDYSKGVWPGDALTNVDGYYTLSLENVAKPTGEGFVFVFHNGSGTQTDDYVIPISAFSGDTAEYWISAAKVGNYGKHFAQVSSKAITDPIVSPEITTSGVTFRYVNAFEDTVSVSGSMDGWTSHPMVKGEEGIFTYTYTETLNPGEYEYGFSVNGWTQDPNNELRKGNNNTFTITDSAVDENASPVVDGNKVTFRYVNKDAADVYVRGQMTDWSVNDDYKMSKNEETGVHTLEVELTHGAYEYKFYYKTIVDGVEKEVWLRDPKNELKTDTDDPNSIVYVPGTDQYKYTIHYYNPDVDVPTSPEGPDLHIWDKCPGSPEGQQEDFTEITKDADTEKGKTWLTTTVEVPYPHISIIARPTGNWVQGATEKEWTYELKKDAKTAELWLVYNEGLYDKNPFLETYKYTVHYYNPALDQENSAPDLYVWGAGTANPGKLYSFAAEKLDDADNGIKWLTTEIETPYDKIGLLGKPTAGDNEAGWAGKDKDRFYQLKGEAKEAELWYVHGMGVYEEKPMIKLNSVEADLSLKSMDYTQNSVLSLSFNGNKDSKVLIKSASVDASALGISSNLTIDPQLCEVTLSVRDNIAAGEYILPITVVSVSGDKKTAEVSVTVKEKTGDDFDWDEAVIYFMVTDRFFDGDSSNNAANGAETADKNNPGLYHGGDFKGVTEKLDYLKELGVNTIWITPIVENIKGVTVGDGSGDVPFYAGYHGYWASDFEKLNPALGTEAEFETLISTAHEKGMKVMVDVVVNHAGYGMEETDKFTGMLRDKNDVDEKDHELGGYQAGLPDFLTELPEVRNQIIQWQVKWAKKGVDFFRVDTVQHVDDTTWRAFKNELTKANPKFKMIGEYFGAGYNSANGNRIGNGQMDSLLDFNFNEWATEFVGGGISSVETKLADRNKALNNTYLTGQFLSSHDEDGFKQNLLKNGWTADAAAAASYAAATLQITAKGQPVIYYGEEIGLTGANNYPYQSNRYDFNWNELDTQKTNDGSIYNHYKKMLAIRSKYADVFAKGSRQFVSGTNADKYDVFSRSYNGTTLYVGINIDANTAKTAKFKVNNSGITGYRDLYSDQEYTVAQDGTIEVSIPAAKNGGTVVLVASSFEKGLIAPELTIAKGRETTLPEKLTYMSETGEETSVAVTYSMDAVEGVTLDAANRKITVADTFTGKSVELTAAAGEESIKFTVKVVEDKNQITLRLHYHRQDGDYTGWNIWSWREGSEGQQYDFASEDENGGKVATFELEGRSASVLNYIIRKSTESDPWGGGKDFPEDCYVDLSDVLSGTVDYYVESGVFPGTRVLGDDVLIGVKILSAKYNSAKNVVKISTGTPITGGTDGIFTLKRADGTVIEITGVKLTSADNNEYELSLGSDLSGMEAVTKKYSLFYDGYEYPVTMPSLYSSDTFEQEYTYTGNDLGATWTSSKTTFKVWAPTADKVRVNLYQSGTEGTDDLIETLNMTKGEKGVWSVQKAGDLNGVYYTYSVDVDGTTSEACDPYARTTGVNGNRAMVINLNATNPAGWSSDRGPNAGMSYTDSIIYELHVRDFSIDESSGIQNKGKFLGLTEKGTKNATGQTTGLDYLTDLGVTHIHLLPSYDYATVDETKLDTPQYNWGYDPKNYNVPEGSYSTDPYNGAVRVKEMKQMVKTLHDNNINVIMDVVYNHVYDADKFCFNQIVPKYFSRTKADGGYSSGSGCGNDTASERSMVRKYIVDSVNYWADEYHIDGFRFDLVGLLDVDTINEVVNTVHETHPDVVFYGEGWSMDTVVSKDDVIMATQWTSEKTPQFAYFSDTIRDLLKGSGFNGGVSTGFISGSKGQEELLAKCFTAATDWCKSPTQTVNYASCHDNYSLMDKLSVSRPDASFEDKTRMNNLAAAIYMTSEGIPLIHAAEEMLREKLDENGEPVENSYNSSDLVNSIKWSNLDKEAYRNVRDYYKGLIAFRKNHAALRLTTAAEVKANVKYNWISNELVMFVINGKDSIADEVSDGIVVIFNANTEAKDVDLYNNYGVAEGEWKVCINDQKAGIVALSTVSDGKVTVAPISAMVLVKGETIDTDSIYGDNEQQKIAYVRSELQNLIIAYEKLEKGSYTDESWTAFTTALEAARKAVANEAATLAELTGARDNLEAAYRGLAVPEGVVDTGKLKALVARYQEIKEQGQGSYTDESWKLFTAALKEAEDVLAKESVTQDEVDKSYSKLETAYNGLTIRKPTMDSLKALIAEYEKVEKGNYTDESWAVFTEALTKAKEVAAKPDATSQEITQAEEALRAAYNALKVPEGAVDKGKLSGLVKVCRDIFAQGQGNYTNKSWAAFKNALSMAEKLLESETATQEEIDRAYENLKEARDGLIEAAEPEIPEGLWTKWADNSGLVLGEDGKYHITYTGKALKPAILVFDGPTQLKEKTDYTIAYKDNTNASTGEKEATVTIKGKGNYSESFEEKFVIDPVDMNTLDIDDLYALVKVIDNQVQGTVALKPVVKYNGKTLRITKDYTASFVNADDGKTPGIYKVRVQAVNTNFKNYQDIEITIADKATAVAMSKVKVTKIAAQAYAWDDAEGHGKVQTPDFTVSYKNENLTKDEQYTVKYDTVHTEAGQTATIVIKGKGTTYVGEKKVTFKITGQALKGNMVTVDVPSQGVEYTGEAQRPAVTVSVGEKPYAQYEVEYQNNTNVGKATVVVKGINGYTGTVKKTFKITPYDITKTGSLFTFGTNNEITDSIPYAKGGSKLSDENVGARFATDTGAVLNLAQGRDYTLSYKNNAKVGNTASVTIKGKGNFKGTIQNKTFTIIPQKLENLKGSITAGDLVVKSAKKYNKAIPVITDLDGKKLKNKTDFTVGNESYTISGPIDESGNPAVGAEVTINVTAAQGSNYEGSVSTTFRIIDNDKNISKAAIKVNPQVYTGNPIELKKDDIAEITMKIGGQKVSLTPDDFEIVGYANNIKKGTAKVTIHGLREYGGTKTVTFKINAQPMNGR